MAIQLTLEDKVAMVKRAVQARIDESVKDSTIQPPTAEELARIMLAALAMAENGDPLGTVRINPETGATADRLLRETDIVWRVTTPGDQNISYDTRPTMEGWDVAYDPTAVKADPIPIVAVPPVE